MAERERAERALADLEYVVPVIALSNAAKVKQITDKLAAAKLPYYTEPVETAKGRVTRIRAGPFSSREAAEKAVERLKKLGLNPGKVVSRAG